MVGQLVTIEVPEWTPGGWAVGVPHAPGVYAMYAGEPPRTWVAYVGMGGDLHRRLLQHFIRQDSSIVAAAAVRLDLDYVRFVAWWEHEDFGDAATLHAAELVAFDVLEPSLRSRGSPGVVASDRYADPAFRERFEAVFRAPPTGRMLHARLPDMARYVIALEARVSALESKLTES
jgi:hypothetical protein